MSVRSESTSSTFFWRRIHSLMGLWLILYLIEHLIVNSQATLWLGDDGIGFVRLVNLLESLPYLQVIEIVFIGIPILIHGFWGVKRALSSKENSAKNPGNSPYIPTGRNRAFTWQRLTSWVLLFGIIGHVVQMRFINMPEKIKVNQEVKYLVRITDDPGLGSLAERIQVHLEKQQNVVLATANSPGKAMLLLVRETFKNPWMSLLYSIFVLAAAFHAFNGLWTALITWGAVLSYRSQKAMLPICWAGVGMLAFLGLAAIWGSYWVNLRS
jgi:succinate dehydrogenase / fumarate reductase cytochrome b subunit